MTGTALILLLTVLFCTRLKSLPQAARVAVGYLLGIGIPIVALCILARLGVPANRAVVIGVFAFGFAVVFAIPRAANAQSDGGRWVGILAITFAGAAVTALVGRSPAEDLLIDPWTHIAWSRNLPAALHSYPPGFPALTAILGLDDRLIGAFRLAPVILHAALVAQFLAFGERLKSLWPAAILALAYLTVPVAFGKFDPPRPELWAAVLIAASWWVLWTDVLKPRWKYLALGALTAVLISSHLSYLEIGHLVSLSLAVLIGEPDEPARRLGLFLSIALGGLLSLVVSPWPLAFLSSLEAAPLTTSREAAAGVLDPRSLARMLGWTLSIAGAASAAWVVFQGRMAYRRLGGLFPGLVVFGLLNLLPAVLVAAHVYIPISFTPYRYVLAAVLPLALLVTIISGLVRQWPRWANPLFIVLTVLFILDMATRPTFSWALGVAAAVVAAMTAWVALASRRTTTRIAGCALVLAVAVGVRLWTWLPVPPPEVTWLEDHGDPTAPVVTNWPLTNALDALAPQRVFDGLAGNDANIGHHRAQETPPLRSHLRWCGEQAEAAVDSLRASLAAMDALPAYLVLGETYDEAWRLYQAQYEAVAATGRLDRHPYYAAAPCAEAAKERLSRIKQALENSGTVRREFATERVAIYRID